MDKSTEKRFWDKVFKTDGCWLWTAGQNGHGYGSFRVSKERRSVKAHRFSYELHSGRIVPAASVVMHACDNRLCVNPAHLSLGTQVDNMQDAARKGRIRTVGKARQTHCIRGHEFAGANVYWTSEGHRNCRECRRVAQREQYLARNPHIIPRGARGSRRTPKHHSAT